MSATSAEPINKMSAFVAPTDKTSSSSSSLSSSLSSTSASTSKNPGSLEDLHRLCREVFPMCFDGAKLMLQKGLSSHFQVSHTLSLANQNSSYRFGATYVRGDNEPQEGNFPVLLGDMDASGNTSATLIHQFYDKWRLKLQGQVLENKLAAAQGTVEYRGHLFTVGGTLANINPITNSGVFVGNYLRRVTEKLDIGMEMIHQYGPQVPHKRVSLLNYQARYTTKNFVASGVFGLDSIHLCYLHRQLKNLSFAVEFEGNARTGEALTSIGYQADLPDEGVVMRASVDSNWTVCGVFEKKLSRNLPFTLAISGLLNQAKGTGKIGLGFVVG